MANVKDYSSLLSEIVALQLFYRRLNDVQLDNETYSIYFRDVKNSENKLETRFFLINSKKDEYGLTLRQLAGLRVALGKIESVWFDEFRGDQNGAVFQDYARELGSKGKTLEELRFKVVAQLKVKNEFATGATDTNFIPVYQDRCYTGSTEYSTTIRNLVRGKAPEFFGTAEYAVGVREAREKLHKTPLKPGKDVDTNIVRLPIFEII